MHRTAFSNIHFTIEDMVVEGDEVILRGVLRGRHMGEYLGLGPTGKQVVYTATAIRHFVDGRIVEEWTETNMLGLLQQLGAAPSPKIDFSWKICRGVR